MSSDSAYFTKALPIARLLIEVSKGNFDNVPEEYYDYLYHEYRDGCISLAPGISKFDYHEDLENWELDEAIELISKVKPSFWPDLEDIESIDVPSLLDYHSDNIGSNSEDFVEDNLGTSDKVQKVLSAVIESVFGDRVDSLRDRSGNYPSPKNNFLQDNDGTFSGTFKHNDLVFLFEVAPTELGWICTYRLSEKSLDSIKRPESTEKESAPKKSRKHIRRRGW